MLQTGRESVYLQNDRPVSVRKGLPMKIVRSVLIVFLLLMPAFAWADDADYRYPIADSYAATILGTPQNLRPELSGKVPVKTMILETDLQKPEIFETCLSASARLGLGTNDPAKMDLVKVDLS